MTARVRGGESWRSLRVAAWLGWQIESNWTDPFLFAVYSVVKPVAGALILVFMYLVVARGGLDNPLFPYVFVGNAFYIYVGAVLMGISWVVIDDREHYGMLKYLYTAPLNIYTYLIGRGAAQTAIATVATTITLLFGVGALGISIPPGEVDWGLLAVALVLGLCALAFMGILLAGVTLITARHNYFVGQGVAGALYLLCGAVFPLDVLPRGLAAVGRALPVTYWLEALRRALLGGGGSQAIAALSNGALFGILAGSTATLAVLSVLFYRWAERLAHRKGLLDMQTMY
ncbi:MAG: ABC transporter permease [Candidatus Acetothermia bacterium]|jgi:ABC-2 type transport system permease protein|nr:ABC transporter permease [Candidatus Acetothermia bacterium]